jgi:mRNA-degrading endonuclease toxin of MazEF toxin-antitoxin module
VTFRRWDVIAVNYPFVEGHSAKRRPGLIISGEALHLAHDVYFVAMITTAKAGQQKDDIPIRDHLAAGLPEACVIRMTRVTTLSDQQIDRRLGAIAAGERNAVQRLLKQYVP